MTVTVNATYSNGKLTLDRPVPLKEMARVEVTISEPAEEQAKQTQDKPEDPLAGVIGICKGGPKDLAENHDKYLYGGLDVTK